MENKINCLIILGMYRSGTSTLAGCLNLLGVNFGENGRFENNDLILVHDILLRDLGCKWDMVGNLPKDWQESEAADRARQSIKSILGRNFSSNKIWAVKDPRMCRLMPLWLPLMEEMGINPGLILNLRHPLETARSLAEKNGFDLRKGLLLWLSHYREAFSACLDNSNVVITYDQLLADPVFTLKFISESLDVDYPRPLQKTYLKILDFVRPEMKHQHSGQSHNKEELEFAHFIHFYDQIRRLFAEKATSLTADAGKKPDVYQYNKELLPSVLQHLSSEDSVSNIQNSKREKAALASGRLFNDILSLIGDHERVQHSLHLERERRLLNSTNPGTTLFAQVYFPQEQDVVFTEEKSKKILLAPVEWQEITVLVPDPILVKNKGLRLKPLNTRGIIHISSVKLVNSATGEEVFKIEKTEEFEKLRVRGDGFSLPGQDGLALFVFNNDPQIIFPPIPDLPDCPLELRVWIKALTNQEEIKNLWIHEQNVKEELNTEKHRLETDLSEAQEQLTTARARIQEEQKAKEELNTEKHRLETDLSEAQEQLITARARIQEEQKAKEELNTEKHRLESDLSEAQEQLITARAQNRQEQERINQLNLENSRLSSNNHLYAGKNKQLKRWMDQLQNDFNALKSSMRWRTGNAFVRSIEFMLLKGKKPGAANHMQQVFASYKSMQENERTESQFHQSWNLNQSVPLDRLMQQLENDVSALSNSARWKVGNAVIRIVEIMLLRGRPRLALNNMQGIFSKYQTKKDQGQNISPWLMQEWMSKLESDFHDILASKRWQIGNSLVRGLEMLLLRKKKPMATDHMQKLFAQFSQGQAQYTHHSNDSNGLPVERYSSQFNTYVSPEQASGDSYTLRGTNFKPVGSEDADSPRPSPFGRQSQQVTSVPGLNVLFVSHSRISTNSGYHVQHYAEAMSRQGVACMVAVPKMDDDEQNTNKAYQVCTYKEIERNGLTFLDGRGPDIVHAWTPREHVRKFCFKLVKKYSFKTIIHLEDNEEYLTENALGRPYAELAALSLKELDSLMPAQRFHPIRGWEWLKKAHGLTLIIDTLQRFNPNGLPSLILPAPVDERLFYPRPINYELRRRLNIPANHLVLSYTGNVRALKRQEALEMYKAVVLLNKQGCPTTLIRTGTNFVTLGKDESWYQEFEKPLGWVSRHEVADVMAASDMLVQPGWPGPFDDQRFPAKLPEYFAMGRPVILPRTNLGLKVEHGKEAWVVDRADAEGIAGAVLEISKDKEMAKRLADGSVDFYLRQVASPPNVRLDDYYRRIEDQAPKDTPSPRPSLTDEFTDKEMPAADLLGPAALPKSVPTARVVKAPQRACLSVVNGDKSQGLMAETIAELKNTLRSDLTVVPCVETALEEKRLPELSPWIGFVHSMPARVPGWLAKLPPYDVVSNGAMFSSDVWNRAKTMCRGLFVQSSEHAQRLRPITGVPVHPLRFPLPKVERKWSWAAFGANPDKKVIQVGWWMQRAHAIHILPVQGMEKIWIRGADPALDAVMLAERQHLKDRHILFDFMMDSVTTIADSGSVECMQLLEKNVVFSHYYDANALDLVLVCIAGHTPILINPYTAIRDFLGNDYPLYYYFYKDAAEKAADAELVRKAHEHLRQLAEKYGHGPGDMAKEIKLCIERTAN